MQYRWHGYLTKGFLAFREISMVQKKIFFVILLDIYFIFALISWLVFSKDGSLDLSMQVSPFYTVTETLVNRCFFKNQDLNVNSLSQKT